MHGPQDGPRIRSGGRRLLIHTDPDRDFLVASSAEADCPPPGLRGKGRITNRRARIMNGSSKNPPPSPVVGRAYITRMPLPDSGGGADVPAGDRLRLIRSEIVPRDLDRMLTFEHPAGARKVFLTEADPRTENFFREPAGYLEPDHCEHPPGDGSPDGALAGLSYKVMGEEYRLEWRTCRCGAVIEELRRDSMTGEHASVFEPPLDITLNRIARARACPSPDDPRCGCPAHEEARGGWE